MNYYHLKFSFQLKPPQVISEAVMYSKESSDITSMIGHATVFLLSAILANRGSSQPSVHSQWASRKVITFNDETIRIPKMQSTDFDVPGPLRVLLPTA